MKYFLIDCRGLSISQFVRYIPNLLVDKYSVEYNPCSNTVNRIYLENVNMITCPKSNRLWKTTGYVGNSYWINVQGMLNSHRRNQLYICRRIVSNHLNRNKAKKYAKSIWIRSGEEKLIQGRLVKVDASNINSIWRMV